MPQPAPNHRVIVDFQDADRIANTLLARSLDDLEVSSVKKKLKDKAFARSVNRDDIKQGVEELAVNMDEHIRFVIDALRPVQKEIGLNAIDAHEATGGAG